MRDEEKDESMLDPKNSKTDLNMKTFMFYPIGMLLLSAYSFYERRYLLSGSWVLTSLSLLAITISFILEKKFRLASKFLFAFGLVVCIISIIMLVFFLNSVI